MDADLENDLRRIIDAWGSEQALHEFIDRETQVLVAAICDPGTEVPTVLVVPSFFAHGLLEGGPRRSGEYQAASQDMEASISLFPSACGDKEITRIALAHEIIHHWEATAPEGAADPPYPCDADSVIGELFVDSGRERSWRAGHSPRFIGKAAVVAAMLGISFRRMLVHR
jgi:hypothetical protein